MTILLIEDDKRLANFISLSLVGIKIIVVETLATAQEILLTIKPNLLLIDLNLPDSHGLDTLKALKSFHGPKIVITGRAKEDRLDMKSLGIIDYIEKTAPMDDLIARIKFNVTKLMPKQRFDPNAFKEIQACISDCKKPILT